MHGELGTLAVPDPNQFAGEVQLALLGHPAGWQTLEPSAGYDDSARGVGLVDFAASGADRPARAGADIALHSLEIMSALLESAADGHRKRLTTTVARPLALPLVPKDAWSA